MTILALEGSGLCSGTDRRRSTVLHVALYVRLARLVEGTIHDSLPSRVHLLRRHWAGTGLSTGKPTLKLTGLSSWDCS